MKWVEIISLRCPSNIDMRVVEELFRKVSDSDSPRHLVEIRAYRHSMVETDLSIHIHWESGKENLGKSPLGLRFSSALRNLGLLNHAVWVETMAREINNRLVCKGDVK